MTIYLPQQKSFMDQFLGTGVMNNIMQSIMLGVQNRREDELYTRGLQEQGYKELPDPATTEGMYLTADKDQPPQNYTQPKPDVTVGGGRGLLGTPQRGFKRPAAPKAKWELIQKGDQLFSVTTQPDGKIGAKPINKKETTPASIKEYKFAQLQFENGVGKDPGDYTTWSRGQKRSGATRISMGEKVKTNKALQISKMQTGIRSPAFKEKAKQEVMRTPDSDLWQPQEVELKTREEMDRRIRNLYPGKDVTFEKRKKKDGTEVLGWFVNGKLVRLAE